MTTRPDLATLVTTFCVPHLAAERNVSPHTASAYRDALKLLLRFASDFHARPVARLTPAELTPDAILAFLDHLETARHNAIRTRNARLAAIHTFFRFILDREAALAALCHRVLALPLKKALRPRLGALSAAEVGHLLAQVERGSPAGARDYLLLALLYDTGARIQELLDVTPRDFRLAIPASVRLVGKGRRERGLWVWPPPRGLGENPLTPGIRRPAEVAPRRVGGKPAVETAPCASQVAGGPREWLRPPEACVPVTEGGHDFWALTRSYRCTSVL